MRFCAEHSNDLESAWASLPASSSTDPANNPPALLPVRPAPTGYSRDFDHTKTTRKGPRAHIPQDDLKEANSKAASSAELSTLLLSLRKLREAILATASLENVKFAQRVHVFSVRLSILARHPPSYFPSLRYLLDSLHSTSHPLSKSELTEFMSYLILDYACRQDKIAVAWEVLLQARKRHNFQSALVYRVVLSLTHNNWVLFWETRKNVDGYMRALMNWSADHVRRTALKAIGRSYLRVDAPWLIENATGDDSWTWEKLVRQEKLGWRREGDTIHIKIVKPKQPPNPSENQSSNITSGQ
jgi:hypothetical protein